MHFEKCFETVLVYRRLNCGDYNIAIYLLCPNNSRMNCRISKEYTDLILTSLWHSVSLQISVCWQNTW